MIVCPQVPGCPSLDSPIPPLLTEDDAPQTMGDVCGGSPCGAMFEFNVAGGTPLTFKLTEREVVIIPPHASLETRPHGSPISLSRWEILQSSPTLLSLKVYHPRLNPCYLLH